MISVNRLERDPPPPHGRPNRQKPEPASRPTAAQTDQQQRNHQRIEAQKQSGFMSSYSELSQWRKQIVSLVEKRPEVAVGTAALVGLVCGVFIKRMR